MPPQQLVRVGVIGVGALGQHHARVYASLAGVTLAGVHDADGDRARAVAERHGGRAFPSVEALLDEVDAVSVAVPTVDHHRLSRQALLAGRDVLVEKPMTTTLEEADDLIALAEERGALLQVGHIERFNPATDVLLATVSKPRFIEVHRLGAFSTRSLDIDVVLDLMIHDLEIILHLVRSPVKEIRAVGVPVLSPSEDIANVRLLFENGCVANVTASRISPEKMRKIRVFLADAYLSLDYQTQSGEIHRKTMKGITREDVPIDKAEPLASELAAFVDCVARRGTPIVSGEHAAEALKLAVQITQQMRQGAT
jgi:predicted dehydrogenase